MRYRRPVSSATILTVLCLYLFPQYARSSEFKADFTDQDGDRIKTGVIYVKDSRYRMNLKEDGQSIFVIVDQDSGLTRVFVPEDKQYNELRIDGMVSLMNDPFQAYNYTAENGEEITEGNETVNGYDCEKIAVYMGGERVWTMWKSARLNFPIKIVNEMRIDKFIELTDIEEESIQDKLFEIPDGYSRWVDPSTLPPHPPDWAGDIADAPVLKPPFESELLSGDIIRIKIEPGKSVKVKATSDDEEEAVARAIPFKEGIPLQNADMIGNFAQKGVICTRVHETPQEADEVVVHAEKGKMKVMGKFEEMSEKEVSAGEEFRYSIKGIDNIEARFINISDSESEGIFTYKDDGIELSEDKIGPAKYRTVRLDREGEVKKGAYIPHGDELVFKVTKGEILIKMGQFDSFAF